MGDLVFFIRLLLFILSVIGYALYLQSKYDVPYGFGLAVGASFIISVLWLTGLFFKITAAIWILWGLGLLLLVLSVRRIPQTLFNATNIFLFAAATLAFFILQGRWLVFTDDFNHWGTMVRSVLEHQALPDASDPLISFVSYPPGAALWIACFMTLTGSTGEDMYLFAQALLALLFFCPLTVDLCHTRGSGKREGLFRGIILVVILLLAASTMSFSATMKSLCVDGLLAASGVGLMCFVLNFKGSHEKLTVFSIPLLIAVISIKDAGKLYAAFAAIVLVCAALKGGRNLKRRLLLSAVPPAAVFVPGVLWQHHVNRAFPQAATAPHSLNLSRWESVYHSRSPEALEAIFERFIREVLHVRTVFPLLLFMSVLVAVFMLQRRTGERETVALAGFLLVHYLVFLAGLAFVYLFSMAIEWALVLQSYTRYLGTEVCFVLGVCLAHVVKLIFCEDEVSAAQRGLSGVLVRCKRQLYVLACVGMISALAWFYCGNFSFDNEFIDSSRERILILSDGYTGDAAVYVPVEKVEQKKKEVRESQIMYDLRSAEISVVWGDLEALHNALSAHSHFLIYDVDETLTAYLIGHGWKHEIAPGLYSLENAGLRP